MQNISKSHYKTRESTRKRTCWWSRDVDPTVLRLYNVASIRFGSSFLIDRKAGEKNGRSLPAAIEKMTMRLSWTCFHGARYIVTIRQHPDVLHATSRTFNGFERHKIQTFSGGSLLLFKFCIKSVNWKKFNNSHEEKIFCG